MSKIRTAFISDFVPAVQALVAGATPTNLLTIGSNAISGLLKLRFQNETGTTDLTANPTGARTIALPDASGTVALTSQLGTIASQNANNVSITGGTAALGQVQVGGAIGGGSEGATILAGGGAVGLELYGLSYIDFSASAVIDNNVRAILNSSTDFQWVSNGATMRFSLPVVFESSLTIGANTSGAKSFGVRNSAGTITITGTPTGNATLTLPTSTGTLALVSDIVATTPFFQATNFEETSTLYYYGGLLNNAWKINKFTKSGLTRTSATQSNNSGVTTLSAAWTSRASLTYS